MLPIFTYRTILTILIFFTGFWAQAQNVGINTNGAAPNAYALFDADNNGLLLGALLPRLSTASRLAMAGLSGTEDGLVVYDTTTKSFWYWDGTQWVEFGAGGGGGWQLNGNAGTVDGTHFLGTTDNIPLSFRVNNEQVGRIEFGLWANIFFGHESGLNNTGSGNTAVGTRALGSANTGLLNTAIGISALGSNTSGEFNTASGNSALFNNNIGSYNTAQGHAALHGNTTGVGNTAQGSYSLVGNITGNENAAIGTNALEANIAGSHATAIGAYAMQYANSTGVAFENTNVALGYEALRGSTDPSENTGNGNTAVGYRSLLTNTTGYENTATGYHALQMSTTGWQNTAFGAWALNGNTSGHSNTAHGTGALRGNVAGFNNTAVGAGALYSNSVGWQNTALGASTLVLSTGDGNTAIGWGAMHQIATGSFNTAVGMWAHYGNFYAGHGNTALGTGAGTSVDLTGTIAVGYNATAGVDYRAVIGTVANTGLTGGFGAWQDLSDGRFKRHVQEDVPGLEFIARLRPVTYTLDAHGVDAFLGIEQRMDTLPNADVRVYYEQRLDEVSTQRQTGFIAQEVEEAARLAGYDFSGVHHPASENDYYTLGYASFTVPIVKAIQELNVTVHEQQKINEQLREELETLRKELLEMKIGR